MSKRATELEIKRIKKLRSKGLSYWVIAETIGRSESFVRKYAQKEKKEQKKEQKKEIKIKDLTGQKFGKLTAIKYDHERNGKIYWLCECECGNTHIVMDSNLTSGKIKSCGCLAKEKREKAKKKTTRQYKTRNNKGGEIKKYKLSPKELAAYLKSLETKEVQRREV